MRYKNNNYIDISKALKGQKQTGRSFHITFAVLKKKVLAIGVNNYDRVVYKTNMENIKYLVLSLINLAFIQKFLQFLNWEKKIVLILNFLILELITMEILHLLNLVQIV